MTQSNPNFNTNLICEHFCLSQKIDWNQTDFHLQWWLLPQIMIPCYFMLLSNYAYCFHCFSSILLWQKLNIVHFKSHVFTVLYLHMCLCLPSAPVPSFSTGGDMLDFLVQSGEISKRDGLLATWFHRANSKEDMNKALTSKLTNTHIQTKFSWHSTLIISRHSVTCQQCVS